MCRRWPNVCQAVGQPRAVCGQGRPDLVELWPNLGLWVIICWAIVRQLLDNFGARWYSHGWHLGCAPGSISATFGLLRSLCHNRTGLYRAITTSQQLLFEPASRSTTVERHCEPLWVARWVARWRGRSSLGVQSRSLGLRLGRSSLEGVFGTPKVTLEGHFL